MTASFPTSTKTFVRQVDGVSTIDAADVNEAYDEIEAMQSYTPRYKSYVALLTQTGTNAPVATVLENTLDGTVVWYYSTVGVYLGTLTGAFTDNKTMILMSPATATNEASVLVGASRASDNTVNVTTNGLDISSPSAGLADGLLNHCIEIRVYP